MLVTHQDEVQAYRVLLGPPIRTGAAGRLPM